MTDDETTQVPDELLEALAGLEGVEGPAAERATDDGMPTGMDLEARAEADPRSRIELIVAIDAVEAQRDEYLDDLRRSHADFENYRKRVASQITDEVDRATGRMAEAFLPVIDAAEAAFVRHPDEVGPLLNLLLVELKKLGLESLDIAGQPFDPEVAEAVAHEAAAGGEVVVDEVLRSGFRWKGRTLRPAMVRTRD